MRRSIKILAGIVVLFLLLVIVSAAMSGNNSNTSTPTPTAAATTSVKATATPSAAPSNNSSFDPVLAAMMPGLKAEYGAANVTQEAAAIRVDVTYENETSLIAIIDNRGASEASASVDFLSGQQINEGNYTNAPGLVTHFGLDAATAGLGHAPSAVKDIYVKGTGDNNGVNEEYIQYDSLYLDVMYNTVATVGT